MKKIDDKKCSEIALLIQQRKFRRAIALIHKEKLQSNIAAIMNYYNGWWHSDDNIYDFLLEYIDRGQLSYKKGVDVLCDKHVLTDIQKELDNKIYPRRKEVSELLMRHFVLRLLKRDKCNAIKVPIGMELFSFRGINPYVVEQLKNEEIQVVNPDKFNDPFDCLVLSGIRKHKELLKTENRQSIKSYVGEMSRIRVCCFAGWDKHNSYPPYLNTLMWSHYAKDHKGICIKYSIVQSNPILSDGILSTQTRCRLDKVIYKKNPIAKKNILNFNECFLVKDKAWNYENEFRLLYYDSQNDDNFITIPLSAIGLKIDAIYFGLNYSHKNRKKIEKALEGKNVKFFSLGYDKDTLNRIEIER